MHTEENNIKHFTWEELIRDGIKGVSGKVYKIEGGLSNDRYVKLQEFVLEMGFASTANDIIKKVMKAYELLQQPRIMDAGQLLHEIIHGVRSMSNSPHPGLKAAAMFINSTEDSLEDRLVFDESKMIDKINDWRHYDIQDFFTVLTSTAGGLKRNSSANSDGSNVNDQK